MRIALLIVERNMTDAGAKMTSKSKWFYFPILIKGELLIWAILMYRFGYLINFMYDRKMA